MNKAKLKEILDSHKLWLETNGENGEKADFSGMDCQNTDFNGADCRNTTFQHANCRNTDFRYADCRNTDFRYADCQNTILRHADLRGADFDFSCWPLWCGSLDAIVDTRIAAQIAYHFCRLDCDDPDYISARNAIADFANKFHRADECGKIERIKK